ncbi:hypothetical protein F5B22DRAFT_630064 [Xylaria bambusicola]|uniref:uncharacterized protein n=1 Tax=Xylaria bambusicola TaxID=326684 RepID=UPI0020074496|nr:uncharacterized protein F5B22DRAFT_630064 [Xylaria bambusicola]KAI0503198.1 hypothetical protein F5B22DRAFT_630064 [Xylaria bambusicola]
MSLHVRTAAAFPGDVEALNTGDRPSVPPASASVPLQQQAANTSANDGAGTVAQNHPLPAQAQETVLAQGQGDLVAAQARDVELNHHLKRLRVIIGIGAAVILITASAMKAAGCTYEDIKWPVTIEITILTAFLSPTYASIIA